MIRACADGGMSALFLQVDLNTACMRPGASDAQLAQLQGHVLAAMNCSQAAIQIHTGVSICAGGIL